MAHQKKCLAFFALLVAAVSAQSTGPILACTHPYAYLCQLDNVNVFADTLNYSITGYNLPGITQVTVNSNKLAIFKPAFCTTFPSVVSIQAVNVGIEQLDERAFDFCSRLQTLNLMSNQIQVLPSPVFSGATALVTLNLGSNELQGITDDQFRNNIKLNTLTLENNFIGNFPASSVKNCPSLRTLRLYTNNLAKLEYATLLQNAPNLQELSINGNLFACSTLQVIVGTYGNTPIVNNYKTSINRFRLYKMSDISGYSCVKDTCP